MKNIPYFDLFYLKLGNNCNFNCKHCSQGSVPRKDPLSKISPEVIDFLDNYVIEHKNKKKTLIRLWGGEPLLYFNFIKQIVERYEDKFKYTFITNGSLLTKEIVNFVNKYNINVVLSHDGENTEQIRGIDILKNKDIKDLFNLINNKSFMSVITALSPRIDKTIDYFKVLGYENVRIFFVWMINHDGTPSQNELSKINFDEYKKGCKKTIERFFDHIENKNYFPREYEYIAAFIMKMTQSSPVYNNSYISKCSTCGYYEGNNMLELDVFGNIYECHNGNNIVGNISEEYIELRKKAEKCKKNRKKELYCKNCFMSNFCKGVCPTSTPLGDSVWCSFYKTTFSEIMKYLEQKQLKTDITKLASLIK